ncbi:MAG TPA: M13 family metallopeptidase [Thermoplasmata archaeon]|nr:M13 family metallopeptidase [Thermoplasmata archaeon]
MPRFSADYMDRAVDPLRDFYGYATGQWRRDNPVPVDKSIWGAFSELVERNFVLLREILESAATDGGAKSGTPRQQVGEFYASALDQSRRDALRFGPIEPLLESIARANSPTELAQVLSVLHEAGVPGLFRTFVHADVGRSSVYAFYLYQGGLSLPDREYYLAESFAKTREEFRAHIVRMLRLLGDSPSEAEASATTILSLETELARAGRSRADLRDELRNYNPMTLAQLSSKYPSLPWAEYLGDREAGLAGYVIVGQPEFFETVQSMLRGRPGSEWRTYLRWHLLHEYAPFLHAEVEREDFEFFHRTLLGQPEPEPTWKRAIRTVDQGLGEALGQLYVEQHFPPEARSRMVELVSDLRVVFQDRLRHLEWMTEATRQKALAKFDRFTAKIGHPDRFRDYSTVAIRRGEYAGNRMRADAFEVRREMARIGGPVDRTEWGMSPPTVNAYFSPTQNEIVFPAGILQPPFFDVTMDDAVNYGGIGAVIGHEITHGYDDQGRRFDAEGNLKDWWSETDAREFDARAKRVVVEYGQLETLPGVRVNGELTLGENIADAGGVRLAYEALQRRLAADPSRRKTVDGLTAEQRFFISWAQVWRQNCREAEKRRLVTIDPHAPAEFRAVTPLTSLPEFAAAFGAPDSDRVSSKDDDRSRIW